MIDGKLVFEDFEHRIGTVFGQSELAVTLRLEEATLLPSRSAIPDSRPPFSLIFIGPGDAVLPQQLYRLTHEEIGEIIIFLVPVGRDDHGILYQAIFN
ncbi:MAG TPA: hypothetical protein VGG57_08715 [Stellaceae bacterium]|jgi:hypothetical protein